MDGYSEDELVAWRHWRMIGDYVPDKRGAFKIGDIILVPNMPENAFFNLCRGAGRYYYSEQTEIGDLRHALPVEVITKGGVSNNNSYVTGALRSTLKCRSRLWNITYLKQDVEHILKLVKGGHEAELRDGSDHLARAKGAIENEILESVNDLAKTIKLKLQGTLQAAEREPVLCYALTPLMQKIEVMHTGGPSGQGADIEIRIPNPFNLNKKQDVDDYPFIVVIQVKDYVGTVGVEVSDQLKRASESRNGQGQVIGVYILCMNAKPGEELSNALKNISLKNKIATDCINTDEFMKIVAKGFLINSAH